MANNIQEALKEMNQNPEAVQIGGDAGKPSNQSPPETKTETPPATPPTTPSPSTEPKAGEKPPEQTTPATEPKKDTAPTDPKPGEAPVATTPPTTGAEVEVPDPAFYGRLSKLTEGSIKSEQDFIGFV